MPLEPDDSRHGTQNGYNNHGCRCERCREANRTSHATYINKVKEEGRTLGEHGTRLCYDTGCRCDPCRDAHNARSREYKRERRRQAKENPSGESALRPAED